MKKIKFDWKHIKSEPGSWIVLLAVAGSVLLLLSEVGTETPDQPNSESSVELPVGDFAYEEHLEQRLEQLISQINGAGSTRVMVTLFSTEETVYALDTQKKGEGDTTETHVLLENGSALSETTLTPAVCGVAVVCEGGGDVATVARITEMLSALLDLPTNRISVQKMK